MTTHENSLHLYLKDTIKKSHQQLDKHPLLSVLYKNEISVDEYGNALAALHGFYENVEKNITAFLANQPNLFDYQSRLKTPLLEDDLKTLGRTPIVSEVKFPVPNNTAELVGILYVIEGSTMGGQFLARKIGDKFPTRFFNQYGENTAQNWQAFWQFANSVCLPSQYEDVAKMAVLLFELLTLHLQNSSLVYASGSQN